MPAYGRSFQHLPLSMPPFRHVLVLFIAFVLGRLYHSHAVGILL
jgi:hypothetical protein